MPGAGLLPPSVWFISCSPHTACEVGTLTIPRHRGETEAQGLYNMPQARPGLSESLVSTTLVLSENPTRTGMGGSRLLEVKFA